jgi:hypothetical protein
VQAVGRGVVPRGRDDDRHYAAHAGALAEGVMAEYLIQRTGSTIPGVSVPRWFAGLATPTRPLWTANRKEARPFLTEDAAREQLRRIAQPEDQYEIVMTV